MPEIKHCPSGKVHIGHKLMGAGVAASPHCPFAGDTRPGRRGSPQWAFSRNGPEPGARTPSSGVLPALARLSVSPWAPRQGRSPGGSPVGSTGTGVPVSCLPTNPQPKHRFAIQQGAFGRSLQPAWRSMDLRPRSAVFAAPGPKPGPARRFGAEALSPPVAARRLASRLLPDRNLDRSPSSCLFRFGTRRFRNLGTLRSLPLSHPLKGKPAASAWRRLRQPPGLRSAASSSGGTRGPLRSGCGWEGFRPLPVDRLGHVRKLS